MSPPIRPEEAPDLERFEALRVRFRRGQGDDTSPVRYVDAYYDMATPTPRLLWEDDTWTAPAEKPPAAPEPLTEEEDRDLFARVDEVLRRYGVPDYGLPMRLESIPGVPGSQRMMRPVNDGPGDRGDMASDIVTAVEAHQLRRVAARTTDHSWSPVRGDTDAAAPTYLFAMLGQAGTRAHRHLRGAPHTLCGRPIESSDAHDLTTKPTTACGICERIAEHATDTTEENR